MGGFLSRLLDKLRGVKEVRLLMLGLDNAGKTTILYKLKFNQTVTTVPTVGFNVECLVHRNIKFNVWDVGGQDKIRPLWRHYHTGTKAVIFVIDSQDLDRIEEARTELHRIMAARELQDALLLVFANKQDLTQSMSVAEVEERLQLARFTHRTWKVQASCATSGEGLVEGLTWLAECIRTPPKTDKGSENDHSPPPYRQTKSPSNNDSNDSPLPQPPTTSQPLSSESYPSPPPIERISEKPSHSPALPSTSGSYH